MVKYPVPAARHLRGKAKQGQDSLRGQAAQPIRICGVWAARVAKRFACPTFFTGKDKGSRATGDHVFLRRSPGPTWAASANPTRRCHSRLVGYVVYGARLQG